jgi:hypothetical protein
LGEHYRDRRDQLASFRALATVCRHALGPEASDESAKFYLEPKRLLRYNPFIKQLVLLELDIP